MGTYSPVVGKACPVYSADGLEGVCTNRCFDCSFQLAFVNIVLGSTARMIMNIIASQILGIVDARSKIGWFDLIELIAPM